MKRLALGLISMAVLVAGCEPTSAELRSKGISEFQLGRHEEARKLFEQLLDRRPSDPDGLYYMGNICAVEGKYEMAAYYYRCCIDADPAYESARQELNHVNAKLKASGAPTWDTDIITGQH